MRIHYDPQVDALYIELRPLPPGMAETRDLTEDITANYGPDGKIAGLEILDASLLMGNELQKVIVEVVPLSFQNPLPNGLRKAV